MIKNKVNPNNLSDMEILQMIKEEYLEIKAIGCVDFFNRKQKSPCLPYLNKRFGLTFNQILIKAGIPEEDLNFVRRNKQRYMEIINNLYHELGHTPSAKELMDKGYSYEPIIKLFGSYNTAIKECGLEPHSYKTKVDLSKTDMLKMYKKLSSELGRPATSTDLDLSSNTFNYASFSIRFNGINNLRKSAGFNETTLGDKPKYNKEKIIEMLIKEYYRTKKHLVKSEIDNNDTLPNSLTVLKYFKTTKLTKVWAEIDKIIVQRESFNEKTIMETDKNENNKNISGIIKAGKVGENKVAHYLSFLDLNDYYVYNNVNICINGRSQQIDHLVVGSNGIFHLETKNYSGEIYIDKNENWSKSNKYNYELLESPKCQIQRHEQLLKEIIDSKYEIVSVIVMANKYCKLVGIKNTSLNVMKAEKILDFINSYESSKEFNRIEIDWINKSLNKHIEFIGVQGIK